MKRLLVLLLPLFVLLAPAPLRSQGQSRAGVVVTFSDGSVHTGCVSFGEESISGLTLLQRSGLDVIAQTSGGSAAVCKIGPDGCNFPAESCFCKFGGGQQGQYWAYWRLRDGAWQYATTGAGSSRVRDGDVDGWAWGTGSLQSGAKPPGIGFEAICPAVAPTSVPTPTPLPAPTSTLEPTARPTARPAARPTPQPTAEVASPTNEPIVTPSASSTAVPATPTPSLVSTATSTAMTSTITASPTITTMTQPSPTPLVAGTGAASKNNTATANYLVFGVMLLGLLGLVGLVLLRRSR